MTRRRRTRRRRRRRTRRRKSSGTTTTGTRRRKTRPTTAFFISYYQMPGGSIEIAIIRRAREGSKNEIHQNLTPKKMSKSNQVHLWRFGRTGALIFTQNWLNRAKRGVLRRTLKKFPRPCQGVSRVQGTQLSRINWKINDISSGLVTRRLYFFKKKGAHLGRNSRPGESDPYVRLLSTVGEHMVLQTSISTNDNGDFLLVLFIWICYSWLILVVSKTGNPLMSMAISMGNGLVCWI